ncbi:kinase-like domain-containing protein [Xylaria sp. FL1777]|nr:kinase-like domain-containing protein [Xylaria sp. FL1777]
MTAQVSTSPESASEHLALALSKAEQLSAWDNRRFVPDSQLRELIIHERVRQICGINTNFKLKESVRIVATLARRTDLTKDTLSALCSSGLLDKHLPVSFNDSQEKLELTNSDAATQDRLERFQQSFPNSLSRRDFRDYQWQFLCPSFGNAEHRDLDKETILPFIQCTKNTTEGAYALIHKIKIHHAHLELNGRTSTEERNPELALKQLIAWDENKFQQELDGLHQMLRLKHDHLTKLIASFRRGSEYFFILPWADGGNLRDFWEKKTEQRTALMLTWLLEQMVGISGGLRKLHYPSEDETPGNNIHGDISPENILLFIDHENEHHQGTLCITDPGLARYHDEVTSKRKDGTKTTARRVEYAAPESEDWKYSEIFERSRKSDMWSLGCVFLECIIWMLGGNEEVEAFRSARKTPRPAECEFYRRKKWIWSKQKFYPHKQVKKRLKWIRSHTNCRDYPWILKLVDIVDDDLLKIRGADRISAASLNDKLQDILQEARNVGALG